MGKRDAIVLGRIDTVNTAKDRGFVGGGSNEKNCALCSAAGVVNLARGSSQWSTGMVAEAVDSADCKTGAGASVDAQAATISDFGSAMTGRKPQKRGAMNKEVSYEEAKAFMEEQPDKTVFAVCCSGTLARGGECKCHWLNAAKWGGSIRYFDFQPMKNSRAALPGKANPASSTTPFIGVITQRSVGATGRQMHSPSQSGSFDTSRVKMVVLAFAPD